MSNYYIPHLIGENIYHIYEPGGVHTTLIIGSKKALLIDTGYGYGNLRKAVEALTDLPLIVANTHGHFDHAGGNYEFDSVYINKDELPVYFWYMTEVKPVTTKTLTAGRTDDGMSAIPPDLNIDWYLKQNNRHFEMLENHHVFDLGGRMVEAVFLPGHTKGSVVFFDDLSGFLFSGDDISPNLWIQFDHSAPLYDYAAELIKLKKLPLSGIVASHTAYVMSPRLIDWLEFAIANIDDSKAKIFVHPRTGRKAQMFKVLVDDEMMAPVKKIHIIYDKNHKFSEVEEE